MVAHCSDTSLPPYPVSYFGSTSWVIRISLLSRKRGLTKERRISGQSGFESLKWPSPREVRWLVVFFSSLFSPLHNENFGLQWLWMKVGMNSCGSREWNAQWLGVAGLWLADSFERGIQFCCSLKGGAFVVGLVVSGLGCIRITSSMNAALIFKACEELCGAFFWGGLPLYLGILSVRHFLPKGGSLSSWVIRIHSVQKYAFPSSNPVF